MSPRCSPTSRSRRPSRTAASSSPCTSPSPELTQHGRSLIIATQQAGPGAVRVAKGTLVLNADRTPDERRTLVVVNTGDRPVQIGSHIHLAEVNQALSFDRELAVGFRLDIPSGTSRRFEPGASREVAIVALRGRRLVPGIQITSPDRPSDG